LLTFLITIAAVKVISKDLSSKNTDPLIGRGHTINFLKRTKT